MNLFCVLLKGLLRIFAFLGSGRQIQVNVYMVFISEQDTVGVHFFNVFKLANVANAELHIPVSAVHPSLAMHISLFCLLQGYQKHQKTKKMENPCQIPEYCKNLEKPKKNKKTKRENLCISKTSKNKKNKKTKNKKGRTYVKPKKPKKKQNGRTYVPVSGMGSVLLFFLFFEVKPKKQKTKWQNLCPSVWHGVSTFVFLVFRGKTKKTKWQNLCPSVWHGVSTFVFFVFRGKTKKIKKKQKGRTYVPVSGMGSVLLFFCFSR